MNGLREITANRVRGRRLLKTAAISFLAFTALLVLDTLVFPLPTVRLHKPSATFVYARDGYLLSAFAARDTYWRKPVALSEVSTLLRKSVIACEDRWFYYHPGINPISLAVSAFENIKAGKVVRGGSTITMQVARMMEPKRRTLLAKAIEIFRAIQLEAHYSKDEILEHYFNLAPYGGNVEGVGAAAFFYFGKKPVALTASEAALLTSIPNSPTVLRPDLNFEKSSKARDRVLGVMKRRRVISADKYREALAEDVGPRKFEPPLTAPHFTRDLAAWGVAGPEIVSTLDLKIQKACEGIVQNHRGELAARGIGEAAVVVIKNSTAEVLAMVGSVDFFDRSEQGEVNGAMSPRSPGSALKPFVYAMALDKGIVSPNRIIEDLPVFYSGYSPENYDRRFRGAVPAAEALRLSLNVPAVWLCSRVGQRDFYSLLKRGGLSTLERKDHEYGLPIILGACEVSLLELTNLYGALARGGVYVPYKMTRASSAMQDTTRLFSPEASFIISEILTELQRPDFPSSWEFSPNIPKVAWKTGTSFGRKDAWSIGYNPEYTIGVWTGNFSGRPSPDLVGADVAAPILFDIFETVGAPNARNWFERPQGVGTRDVCALSGMIPNEHCPEKISEIFIPGVSPSGFCDVHRRIEIDTESGYRLCRHCAGGRKSEEMTVEAWPPKIATYLAASGKMVTPIPIHDPDCQRMPRDNRPVITSPGADAIYVIRPHIPMKLQQIAFEASGASGTKQVYWFLDGELFCRAEPGEEVFYAPSPGDHKLICTDDAGRSASIEFRVE